MSNVIRRSILMVCMAIIGGVGWTACSGGEEKCPYCGKMFPISNVRFHVRKCTENPTDHRMKPASGKTTELK